MKVKIKKDIKVIQPRRYQEIGARFVISGWVSKSSDSVDFL